MKIFGLGTDIIDTTRIKRSLKKTKGLKRRLFSNLEIKYCDKKKTLLDVTPKGLQQKEKLFQKLGLGISKGLKFKEIEINNNKFGQPFINVLGNSKIIVNKTLKNKIFQIHLSISDDNPFTVATVILTTK